jgi:hypothetical protein
MAELKNCIFTTDNTNIYYNNVYQLDKSHPLLKTFTPLELAILLNNNPSYKVTKIIDEIILTELFNFNNKEESFKFIFNAETPAKTTAELRTEYQAEYKTNQKANQKNILVSQKIPQEISQAVSQAVNQANQQANLITQTNLITQAETDELQAKYQAEWLAKLKAKQLAKLKAKHNANQNAPLSLTEKEYQINIVFDIFSNIDKNKLYNDLLKEKNLIIVRFKIINVDKRYLNILLILKYSLEFSDIIYFTCETKSLTDVRYIEVDQIIKDDFINVPIGHKENTYFIIINRVKVLDDCYF